MRLLLTLAMTLLVGALVWSDGHSLVATLAGTMVLVTSLYAFAYSSTVIEKWTGLTQVQNNRTHATYYAIAIGGLIGSDHLWPDAGHFLSMLTFMISLTLGSVVSQLFFGEQQTDAETC